MWKYPNWCCVNNTGSVFSFACGSSEVWLYVLPAAFVFVLFRLCLLISTFQISIYIFIPPFSSNLCFSGSPLVQFFCFHFSFWWAWEGKTRPWPLVVTGPPLWMERTQRRIRRSLLRQPYAVARHSQALTLVCAHSGKHCYFSIFIPFLLILF